MCIKQPRVIKESRRVTTALLVNTDWLVNNPMNRDRLVILGYSDGRIEMYAPGSPMQMTTVSEGAPISALNINRKNRILAVAVGGSATVYLFHIDVEPSRHSDTWDSGGPKRYLLHKTPFDVLPSGGAQCDREQLLETVGHTQPVLALCFSQWSDYRLVSGGEDSSVRFWNACRTPKPRKTHGRKVRRLTSITTDSVKPPQNLEPLENIRCRVSSAPAVAIQSVSSFGAGEGFLAALVDGSFELFCRRKFKCLYRFSPTTLVSEVPTNQDSTNQLNPAVQFGGSERIYSLWQLEPNLATWVGYDAPSETLSLFGPKNPFSMMASDHDIKNDPFPSLDACKAMPGMGKYCSYSWEPEQWKLSGFLGRGLVDGLGILTALGPATDPEAQLGSAVCQTPSSSHSSSASYSSSVCYSPTAYIVIKHQAARGAVAELRVEKAPLNKPFSTITVPRGESIVFLQSVRVDPLRDTVYPYCKSIKEQRKTATGMEYVFWNCDDVVVLCVLSNGEIVLSSSAPEARGAILKRLQNIPGLRVRAE